ncbi:MAG TPA: hypothetical protein VFR15_20090 [Chloroflexia bacterium]|nr:hypothetical protein [Chloroflexia bacterium]
MAAEQHRARQTRVPLAHRAIVAALALAPALALAACTIGGEPTPPPAEAPADFKVTYEWRAGSMPPPYHYEYTVTVGPGAVGEVRFVPNYPGEGVPVWTEKLDVTPEQIKELYGVVVQQRLLRGDWRELPSPPVGGSVEWAVIEANGQKHTIPVALEDPDAIAVAPLYEMVRAKIVPEAVWEKLQAQRQQYEEDYLAKEGQ